MFCQRMRFLLLYEAVEGPFRERQRLKMLWLV